MVVSSSACVVGVDGEDVVCGAGASSSGFGAWVCSGEDVELDGVVEGDVDDSSFSVGNR